MKPIKQTLVSGAMILALSLAFTSCDDILGEWDRPAPNPVVPTPEPEPTPTVSVTGISLDEELKVLISGAQKFSLQNSATKAGDSFSLQPLYPQNTT